MLGKFYPYEIELIETNLLKINLFEVDFFTNRLFAKKFQNLL